MPRKIIPYNPKLKDLARKLRNDSTFGEILLWKTLKGKQLHGYDFHRQKPLLNYIVDFYCFELNLVIEVDGHYHNHEDAVNKDQLRDKELAEHGLTVIRFSENEIKTDIATVLRTLEQHITEHTSSYQEHTI
ncbi:Very-short-patch-repair endonuclease [Mucilaginibacter pineti]|uniref:Very-short-patch-repair endonuclease n=1 Tax=Mucilaginibacter pineti TaxID=1391627 RepID=A0A1G6WJ13_9SPHI|nr:DUF559 domain-containing protein [Mucilaginibacter pineti]SDD65065.1 Very-short-patch-repair endonuclease [Mucilaginibacter pineti]